VSGRALQRAFALTFAFARIGVLRKTQFRVDFLGQVVMDTMWYVVHIATFEVLFEHTETIAGWTRSDVRVFLGMLFLTDAFWMTWLGQSWHFGRELKDGALDVLRLRPGSPIFLYFFQRFSLEAALNGVMALAWLTFALASLDGPFTAPDALRVVWAIALGCWSRTVLAVMFTIPEFYVMNSDLSNIAWEVSNTVADRPVDVFPRRFRYGLLSLVPIAAVASLPAAIVLGRVSVGAGVAHSLWIVALGLIVFRAWRASFHRYESALG